MYRSPRRPASGTAALVALLAAGACADPTGSTAPLTPRAPAMQVAADDPAAAAPLIQQVQTFVAGRNRALATSGAHLVVSKVELMLAASAPAALGNGGRTVLAADHSHRTGIRWVPGDPRRGGRTVVTYGAFQPFMFAQAPVGYVNPAGSVDAAAATWSSVACSGLRLQKQSLPAGVFPSLLLGLPGFASAPASDIGVVGWLPGAVFTAAFAADGKYVLGVTWTYAWADANGDPTDADHDGFDDAAYVEQWFQNGGDGHITWSNAQTSAFGSEGYDAQFVVLHELGHAVGLSHFGRIAIDQQNAVRVSPTAVMNAVALTSYRAPLGTDVGGVCGLYGNYPTR
jgi:hypothetical protein